jgi:hypothetical protein
MDSPPTPRHTIQQTPAEHQLAFPARDQADRAGDALAALPWTPTACQLAFRHRVLTAYAKIAAYKAQGFIADWP